MPNYIFAYHGGHTPEDPDQVAAEMAKWNAWFQDMGDAVVDGGAPVGQSKTVSASGVADDGGANPLSGYTIVKADDMDAAVEMAKGCPIVATGSIEVAEAMKM